MYLDSIENQLNEMINLIKIIFKFFNLKLNNIFQRSIK